jgi:hypothetical protein
MIPADHAGESVIAVGLRVECIMAFEESPICECNRFEIFLTEHFKQNFFASTYFYWQSSS